MSHHSADEPDAPCCIPNHALVAAPWPLIPYVGFRNYVLGAPAQVLPTCCMLGEQLFCCNLAQVCMIWFPTGQAMHVSRLGIFAGMSVLTIPLCANSTTILNDRWHDWQCQAIRVASYPFPPFSIAAVVAASRCHTSSWWVSSLCPPSLWPQH